VRWRAGEVYGVGAAGQMIGLWPACVGGGQPVPGGGVLSHRLYVAADGAGAVAAKPVQMAGSDGLAAGGRAVAGAGFLRDGPAAGVGEGLCGGGGEFLTTRP
jgi:hypothetical protein